MTRPARLLLRLGVLLLLVATAVPQPTLAAGPDNFVVETDVMVPMRDGVRLATDVYRPAAAGRPTATACRSSSPACRTTRTGRRTMGRYYATHGYVFVAQDTRGRYKSEGVWHLLTDDGPDGVDCAAWVGKQPGRTAGSA
jgi:predicted acyl esterase